MTLATLAVLLPALLQTAPTPAKAIAIRAGQLIDGRGGPPARQVTIVIRGDRIEAVGREVTIPKEATVIDLSNATVLPGLIDLHTHITSDPEPMGTFRTSHVDAAIMAPTYARRTVEAGFTTVRDLGAPELVDIALRGRSTAGPSWDLGSMRPVSLSAPPPARRSQRLFALPLDSGVYRDRQRPQ